MGQKIRGRQHGTSGEAHVLRDHGRMVVATACQIGDQFGVREGVRIHGLQLAVFRNGCRFAVRVPVVKLLSPKLVRKDLLGTRKALRDLRVRRRQHLIVAEAVHVADLETVDKQPVEAGKIVGTSLERKADGSLESSASSGAESAPGPAPTILVPAVQKLVLSTCLTRSWRFLSGTTRRFRVARRLAFCWFTVKPRGYDASSFLPTSDKVSSFPPRCLVACSARLPFRSDLAGNPRGRCHSTAPSISIRGRDRGASRIVDRRRPRGGCDTRDRGGAHIPNVRGILDDEYDHWESGAPATGSNVGRRTRPPQRRASARAYRPIRRAALRLR